MLVAHDGFLLYPRSKQATITFEHMLRHNIIFVSSLLFRVFLYSIILNSVLFIVLLCNFDYFFAEFEV